ncbi:PAS domain-containing protein [Geomonas sp. Red69]|uniref:histidine kinase n=1 Tax=Geomonas diazotrophica TaxID=2843197 RepID=A0ABX8JRZ8_9BACT|nr:MULTISPECIES: PAS domain-containing protein [Geomonas]MBU5637522.1 PAS domain-containing protein [Geomonas diazotrophica]QWV99357.1 PAS domain-containing protein [Geomonas nitrogeniifigens]
MNRLSQVNQVTDHNNSAPRTCIGGDALAVSPPALPAPPYEQVLRNMFWSAPSGVYQTDTQGRPLASSPCCSAGPGDAGTHRMGYLNPQEREGLATSFQAAMEAGQQWNQQFQYHFADGAVSRLRAVVAPLRGADGLLIGYQVCTIDTTAQYEAHQELALSEDRHRVALDAAELGIWDFDVAENDCYFSPYCYEMLGYSGGQMQVRLEDWTNIIHPQYLENARRVLENCISGAIEKFEIEFRLKTNEGKWHWFRCTGKAAERDASGKARRLAGTLLDINQAKLMEHLLQMEHGLLNLITATSPVGIMFIESDGNTTFVNPKAERILGLTKQQMAHREPPVIDSIFSAEQEQHTGGELSLGQILEQGRCLLQSCFIFTRPDGSSAVLSISTAPFLDTASTVSGTVVTLEDVTEQKKREQVLADNDRLLRETQRIAQLGSYVLDLAKDQWVCSSKLEEILGIDAAYPKTLQGHFEIVHEEFREQFIDSYRAAISNDRPFEHEYKIRRHNDGEERWVTECCELTRDAGGKQARMIGTIKDITERKAAEEAIRNLNDELDRRVIERTSQLVAAKKEIESFSYSVSHDLRAPLRHINSYSSILVEEHGNSLPEEARYYLERICTASNRMGKQIDDLLALTRVGRAIMKRSTFNISQLAADVVDMLSDESDNPPEFVVQPGISAFGDSALVRLVLQNLLGNSVKYSSRTLSPRIEFGQTLVGGRHAFFVRDNGVGFDMAYVEKLFQPFQRLHGSEFEGTGIGLATVRRIIERHGGSIWAEGKEHEGATFYFTLSNPRKADGTSRR